jgi:hypothetical protein
LLYDETQWRNILATFELLREKFGRAAVDGPFVPYVGDLYREAGNPKIMFIGKAAPSTCPEGVFTQVERAEESRRMCLEEVAVGNYSSHFWYFLRTVVCAIHRACGLAVEEHPDWSYRRLVWSNIMKIAMNQENPSPPAARIQRPLCEELIRTELNQLKPDAVVIVTNVYENALIRSVFGREDNVWERTLPGIPAGENWTWRRRHESGAMVYFTRHPQGWQKESRDQEIDAIARDFAAHWAHGAHAGTI